MPSFLEITREKFYRAVAEESGPYFAWFSLNDQCNLNCRYCFADAKYIGASPSVGELTTGEVMDILDNVVDAGTRAIQFAGGEPTLRKDLEEIINYASHFVYVALNTNGQLIDEDRARSLAQAGVSQVKVSVDGLKENHEWCRGKGTFEKAVEAIRNFKKYGVPCVMMIMTLSRKNYADLPDLFKLSRDLGADFIMVEFVPMGHSCNKAEWVLTKEQRKEAQRYLAELQKTHGLFTVHFENRYLIAEQEETKKICADPARPCGFYDFSVGCISGIYSYCINSAGKVTAGDILTLEAGDLKMEKMTNIWKNAEVFKYLRNRENLKGKCGRCQFKYVCGGCRRRAYTSTGDVMGADPACWVSPDICLDSEGT